MFRSGSTVINPRLVYHQIILTANAYQKNINKLVVKTTDILKMSFLLKIECNFFF